MYALASLALGLVAFMIFYDVAASEEVNAAGGGISLSSSVGSPLDPYEALPNAFMQQSTVPATQKTNSQSTYERQIAAQTVSPRSSYEAQFAAYTAPAAAAPEAVPATAPMSAYDAQLATYRKPTPPAPASKGTTVYPKMETFRFQDQREPKLATGPPQPAALQTTKSDWPSYLPAGEKFSFKGDITSQAKVTATARPPKITVGDTSLTRPVDTSIGVTYGPPPKQPLENVAAANSPAARSVQPPAAVDTRIRRAPGSSYLASLSP